MSQTQILKDYTIGKVLGAGSFAVVYKAEHKPTKNLVAIKSIKPKLILNSDTMRYVETEIEIMRSICHPHLISCSDYIKSNSHVYLVMEYCSMGDLHSYIKHTYNSQGMPEAVVLHFLEQLASALKYLHDRNLIHRDIKPKNIFLVSPSSTSALNVPDAKLGDFGFAKTLPKTSLAMSVLGSPIYMAPEVLNREPYNYKADIWSLGVVLHELMTGHTLFQSANMENLRATVEKYNDCIPLEKGKHEYCTELKDLLNVLLKRHPEERASCEDLYHYIKLITQKDAAFLIDSDEFQKIEDEYIVIESEPPPSSSVIAPTPPLMPNIQRSHSVDYYQKRPVPVVRDRRHSAGSNASILTRAISMAPFNLFGAHRANQTTEKTFVASSFSSSAANTVESIIEEDSFEVKYVSSQIIKHHTGLNVELFKIASSLIRLFNSLFEPTGKAFESNQTLDEESIALIKKIVFLLKEATTVSSNCKHTTEEYNLLEWGRSELDVFMLMQSKFKHTHVDQRVIQRLLYDNAVEMSREAAVSQLVGEDLYNCKTKYEESILLLKAVLIIPTSQHVKRKDTVIIENLIQSLKNRIKKISPQIPSLQDEIEILKL